MGIAEFHNLHKNEMAFVICNGPHLLDIDVSKLNGHINFMLNRGYTLEKYGLDVAECYLVAIDPIIIQQFQHELDTLKCKAKFSDRVKNAFTFQWGPDSPDFTGDPTKQMWQGHSVTIPALNMAYYMGCNPVYIIGMDHKIDYNSVEKVDGGKYKVTDKDPNHFDSDYLPKGNMFYGQSLVNVERGYALAYEKFSSDERILMNASTKTALSENILPRIDIRKILGDGALLEVQNGNS